MKAAEVKQSLLSRAEEVVAYLLPNGRKKGHEWVAGSVSGDAGESLKVSLVNGSAGVWKDFAGSESDKGDILELWKRCRGVDFTTALKQAGDYLGIKDDYKDAFRPAVRNAKTYVKPAYTGIEPLQSGGSVFEYLANIRMLDPQALNNFKVCQALTRKGMHAVVFNVYDNNGKGIDMVKYLGVSRIDGKKMIWSSPESKPHLFGWQSIKPNDRCVVITEGEIDCLTVAGWGFPALSLPQGAMNMEWIEHDFDALERFEKIYVCTDMDEAGNKAAFEMSKRLGRERCFRVKFDGYKDANEALCSGKFIGPDFEALLDEAATLDPAELRNANEYGGEIWEELNPTQEMQGSETPWGIPWRVRPGEVTLWTGWSGHGKSLLLNHLALHDWATARSSTLIASFEMPVRKSITQLAKIALGRIPKTVDEAKAVARVLGSGFWFYDVVDVKPWREFLPTFEYAIKRYGIKRIIIDSLLRVGIAEDDYEGQKEFVSHLTLFAKRHLIHIHLVAHSRKRDDESKPPLKLDVRGAAAITDQVDNGWSVWRNKQREQKIEEAIQSSPNGTVDEKIMMDYGASISCWKNRDKGVEPFRKLWLNPGSMQFMDSRTAIPRQYISKNDME